MKKFLLVFLLCLPFSVFSNSRREYSINESWQFRLGQSELGEEGWNIVSVPHTWNAEDALDDVPGFHRGVAWYRKIVSIDDAMLANPLYIFFEGVNQCTEVFVNNHKVGEHIGGYTFFSFDISKYVKKGENKIAVRVDNSYDENIPPLSADFTFFGGIYRDVSLISVAPVHVSVTHYASSGVYISTPEVSKEKASVEVIAMLTNTLAKQQRIIVEHNIISADGRTVSRKEEKINIKSGDNNEFKSRLYVDNPELWSVDTPKMYRLETSLYDTNGNLLDRVNNNFGIRKFSFSAEKGFVLNDKHVKLIGTNRHQCFHNKGIALNDEMHIRDVELLDEMGGNFLRVAHYPQDEMVLAACDRMGIVTSVEIPIVNAITMSQEFSDNCVEMMKEMIYQCFNSPSVCIWTYMNEVMLRPPYISDTSISKNEYLKYLKSIAKRIENTAKSIDLQRYTMLPCHSNLGAYEEAGILDVPDILGLNLYNGWYGGNLSGFEATLDKVNKKYPDRPIIVSEYGADVDARVHSYSPERFDFSVDYGVMYHRHYLPEILKRDFVVASAVWNINDFHSEERMDAVPHINCKGLVTLDRTPKDAFRYYQAMLRKEPFVAIAGTDWYNRAGVANESGICTYPILVYNNLEKITLSVNGKKIGTAMTENGAAQFHVPFSDGVNLLEAEGFSGEVLVKDFCKVSMKLIPEYLNGDFEFKELNMLMGSNRNFEDKDAALAWLPEKEYKPGSWGYIGGEAYRAKTKRGSQPASNLDIYGTDQDPIYQTQRRNLTGFKADLPDGNYTVYLYWTELAGADSKELAYQLGDGVQNEEKTERVFHVDINNNRIISSLNVVKEAGVRRPMIKKIPVTVSENSGLEISLLPVNGETMLTAIRIVKMSSIAN